MSGRKRDSSEEWTDFRNKRRRENTFRRRILSSSSSDDELTDRHNNGEIMSDNCTTSKTQDTQDLLVGDSLSPTTKETESLDDEILVMLGDAPKNDTVLGKPIHKDIAARWQEILLRGLPKETKEKLLKDYLVPSNCEMIIAPKLNAETKAAIAENLVKRDNILEIKQNQIGAALSALSQAVDSIIEKDFSPQKVLKPISDACRILCDSHYNETKTRRHFILSSINSEMKETMSETARDKYLFGQNFSETLRLAKTIKKSGIDLKPTKAATTARNKKFYKNNFLKNKGQGQLNWRSLQRKPAGKADAGPQRTAQYQYQYRNYNTRSGFQQREAADRSSPPRQRQPPRRRQ